MIRENLPLSALTTLGVGGPARFFADAVSETDVRDAIALARERGLPLLPLGNGSNLLVPDEGVDAVVVKLSATGIRVEEQNDAVLIEADAGASWDRIVDIAAEKGAYGIENLAAIPGTVAGAVVQNIGAYGGELSRVFQSARVIHRKTGEAAMIDRDAANFSYRSSLFKEDPDPVILGVRLLLRKDAEPNLAYADLVRAKEAGVPLATPGEIAAAVRGIRARKFPEKGTAGSFFKNPALEKSAADALIARYPELPAYPQQDGSVKVSLAWLLDHALSLRGYGTGLVRLYEKQPLVVVAEEGASASDVDAFARDIAARVHDALAIAIEREVETFGARA